MVVVDNFDLVIGPGHGDGVDVGVVGVGVTDKTWLRSYAVPLTTICGVPSDDCAPNRTAWTTPVSVFFEFGCCTITVAPIKLLACIAESDVDIALVCDKDVNCAICAAICVSDCGWSGS